MPFGARRRDESNRDYVDDEWQCKHCKAWTRNAHRHCTYCGRHRYYLEVGTSLALIVAVALFLIVHG